MNNPKCNQCDSLVINGIYTHEHGCPNTHKVYNHEDGEWENVEEEGEMDFLEDWYPEQLTEKEKIERLKSLYSDEDIADIIGYYDGSNEDVHHLGTYKEGSAEFLDALYKAAITNGNFEDAIAQGYRMPL